MIAHPKSLDAFDAARFRKKANSRLLPWRLRNFFQEGRGLQRQIISFFVSLQR